jgi:hypothetical protein
LMIITTGSRDCWIFHLISWHWALTARTTPVRQPVLVAAHRFCRCQLLQFGFSKFCPLGLILKKLGVPEQR